MRSFLSLFVLFFLLLNSCGKAVPTAPPRFEMPGNPGGRLCITQCREARDHCFDTCQIQQRQCTVNMQTQAIKDYEAYAREQLVAHLPLELRPRDFERPETCKPVACHEDCENPYRDCFEKCGGKIVAPNSCTFLCF